jgi:hypothetical protein
MFFGTAQVFPSGLSVFFLVSSVCLVVHVTMVYKNKACRLLFAGHIGQNVIRKEKKSVKCGVRRSI